MKFAFRADASIEIGTGHIMRCLTLANALASNGSKCAFICREHSGNLIDLIQSKGHSVFSLPMGNSVDGNLTHSAWLGSTQEEDAIASANFLAEFEPEWLVVDHYALDMRWEGDVSKFCGKLMVIDDLADRKHECNILLDQTFGRDAKVYSQLVKEECALLCGTNYTLLRPEYSALRPYSLQRRIKPQLKRLLINMGGVDKDNVTAQVLKALRACKLASDCKITVVMGATAPWVEEVHQEAKTVPWPTTVRVGVTNMAKLMADSDLAIGAAGGTSWERCCLGLPTILIILAENQRVVADGLEKAGASLMVELNKSLASQLAISIAELCNPVTNLIRMSQAASNVVTGQGLAAVVSRLGA